MTNSDLVLDDWTPVASAAPAQSAPTAADDWVAVQQPSRGEAVEPGGVASVLRQVPVGFNEGLASVAGAPVDLATWALNLAPRAVNAVAGREVVSQIEKPFLGSESIKQGLGVIGANPDDSPAHTTGEKVARGFGAGVASAVVPEAALVGLGRAGLAAAAPLTTEALQGAFGAAASAPAVVTNAAVGGVAGGSGTAAAEAAPAQYKPIAEMAGSLLGGGVAIGGVAAGQGARALGGAVKDYVAPMTSGGRERIASEILADRATSPRAAVDAIDHERGVIVPGSEPTTFQQTGDMGLGSLEREVATRHPADFNQRRADQNAARVESVTGLQRTGSPADVSAFFRAELQAIDDAGEAAVGQATRTAQDSATALGGQQPPEVYADRFRAELEPGATAATTTARQRLNAVGGQATPDQTGAAMRGALSDARGETKRRERALWEAVDPDGTLMLRANGLRQTAREIEANVTASAAPISGEERAILDVIHSYQSLTPFREFGDLRSRISTAMREEQRARGNTPVYARMARLRSAVESAIGSTVERRAAAEADSVARGELSPEQTMQSMFERMAADRDAWNARRAADSRTGDGAGAGSFEPGAAPAVPAIPRTEGQGGERFPGATRGEGGDEGGFATFDAAAQERLNEATAATRERAQTFDTGVVGNVLRTNGTAGQFRTVDSAVPDSIFRPGPNGYDSVQAYRRGVGDDQQAVAFLSEHVANSLRRAAERPDGTLDPAKYGQWRRRYQDALRAVPELRERFESAGRAAEALDNLRVTRRPDVAYEAPENYFHAGPGGFESVGRLRERVGDDRASALIGDYAASRLRSFAMRDDGAVDPAKFERWRAQHADALRAIPDMERRFADAASATEAIGEAAAARRAAADSYQRGAAAKLLNVAEPEDVTRVIGGIFGQKDAVASFRDLANRTSSDPAAREGLRKAVVDHIVAKFVSNTEVGTSGVGALKSDGVQSFVRQNAAALRQVFTPNELASINAVVDDLQRANRSIVAVKLLGQSNTAQDLAAQRVSLLGRLISAARNPHARGATVGGGAGFVLGGGPWGAAAGAIGGAVVSNLRQAGLDKVDDLVKAALLDPKLAQALLQKATDRPPAAGGRSFERLKEYLNRVSAQSIWHGVEEPTGDRRAPVKLNSAADVHRRAERTADPTPAQAVAGNYAMRHLRWKGLDLSIETEAGQERAGVGQDGQPWSVMLQNPYGRIKGTKGADGDALDVYIGPHPHSQHVFIIDQRDPRTGEFDEHKIVIGGRDQAEAKSIYDAGFNDGSGPSRVAGITEFSIPEFKQWIANGDTSKPVTRALRDVADRGAPRLTRERLMTAGREGLEAMLNDPRKAKDLRVELGAS